MWNKNRCLSLGILVITLITIFNSVYAGSRVTSGKRVKTDHRKSQTGQHSSESTLPYKKSQLRNDEASDTVLSKSKAGISSLEIKSGSSDSGSSSGSGNDPGAPSGSGSEASGGTALDSSGGSVVESSSGSADSASPTAGDDDEDDSGGENEYDDEDSDDDYVERALQTGDLFTPIELLPVTTRLMRKLETKPGEGRGIVSSSKSSQDMADRIFAAYFLTMKRIVVLKDDDIPGLDALQALALGGEPANFKYFVRSVTKKPPIVPRAQDPWVTYKRGPKTSHYNLLKKKIFQSRRQSARSRKRIQPLLQIEKKMPKNRHLVIKYDKPGQLAPRKGVIRKTKAKNRTNAARVKAKAKPKPQAKPKPKAKPKAKANRRRHNKMANKKMNAYRKALEHRGCTWTYECKNPQDLDSCHLKATCQNDTVGNSTIKDNSIPHKPENANEKENVDENTMSLKFRRMLGLSVIDEEVEKIIESHVLIVKPENMRETERIESLDEYFNNIIIAQSVLSTKPLSPTVTEKIVASDVNDDNKRKDQSDENDAKEAKEWDVPPYPVPLRVRGAGSSKVKPKLVDTSDTSSEKSVTGSDTRMNVEKPAARSQRATSVKVTPHIVRLLG